MELSFHLLDVPLPHLSPTFKIYIYEAGKPALARLTALNAPAADICLGAPALPGPGQHKVESLTSTHSSRPL